MPFYQGALISGSPHFKLHCNALLLLSGLLDDALVSNICK